MNRWTIHLIFILFFFLLKIKPVRCGVETAHCLVRFDLMGTDAFKNRPN
jgi:hypothetical protein